MTSLITLPSAYSETACIDASKDGTCVQVYVTNTKGQALSNMVVYLEPRDGQILAQYSNEIQIGQLGKSFSPYISVSQANAQVSFVNHDDITHHIYSVGNENKFSFKIKAGQTNYSTPFKHASEVAMGCNIHDWMSGYLLVVNTPYFGKTDEYGQVNFNIAKKGKYDVVVWHPQMSSDNNRMVEEKVFKTHSTVSFTLEHEMSKIPLQESNDDFDFLSDYE